MAKSAELVNGQDKRRISCAAVAKGNQGGKALKWLPAHSNFEERNAPKSKRERPSTLRDWPPCPPIQQNGGRQSRPGVNPFISALTVARCPAIFRECGHTSGHFVHKSERRTRDGGVHIRPVCCRKQTCACGSTPHKHSTVFLPLQMPLPSPAATTFSRQRRQSV